VPSARGRTLRLREPCAGKTQRHSSAMRLTVEEVKSDKGSDMKTIYLDNNATKMVAPEVLEEMKPYFCELYANPSSMHTFGGQWDIA